MARSPNPNRVALLLDTDGVSGTSPSNPCWVGAAGAKQSRAMDTGHAFFGGGIAFLPYLQLNPDAAAMVRALGT